MAELGKLTFSNSDRKNNNNSSSQNNSKSSSQNNSLVNQRGVGVDKPSPPTLVG